MNEYAVWVGGSVDSPTLIGTAEGRKFFTIGLRYGRILGDGKKSNEDTDEVSLHRPLRRQC